LKKDEQYPILQNQSEMTNKRATDYTDATAEAQPKHPASARILRSAQNGVCEICG
jgi:hypothetical protein